MAHEPPKSVRTTERLLELLGKELPKRPEGLPMQHLRRIGRDGEHGTDLGPTHAVVPSQRQERPLAFRECGDHGPNRFSELTILHRGIRRQDRVPNP